MFPLGLVKCFLVRWCLCVRDPRCYELWPFVNIHFNTVVLNFRCFELPLLVSANRCKTTSMLYRLLPLSCCCANHFQFSQSLSFSNWGWSGSCRIPHQIHSFSVECLRLSGMYDFLFVFMEWVCSSLIQCILCFEKFNPIIIFMFWSYFVSLLLVLHIFLETNGRFILNMDSDICDDFIGPNSPRKTGLDCRSYWILACRPKW